MNKPAASLIGSLKAAERFGVSRATFNRWVAEGRIPVAVAMEGATGARLFDPDVIDALVWAHAGEPPQVVESA